MDRVLDRGSFGLVGITDGMAHIMSGFLGAGIVRPILERFGSLIAGYTAMVAMYWLRGTGGNSYRLRRLAGLPFSSIS